MKLLRILLGLIPIILVVAIALAFLGMRLIKKSLPAIDGEVSLAGITENVTVYRDNFGVPHLFAKNDDDLWFAAGYVAAQDRLWQMDMSRRAVRGTLSEIFGERTLPRDKFLRTWGFHRIAQKIAANLSPESRTALSAYTAGVNEFVRTNSDKLPVEFSLLGYKPDLWEIEDSIGMERLMGFRLCYSWYYEGVLGKVAERLGLPMAMELFPTVQEATPNIVADRFEHFDKGISSFLAQGLDTRSFLGIPPGTLGSNSWVISGQRSTSGKPMLANDPHLELTIPSVWYEMHLNAGTLDVHGFTLPGAPGVIIGHNPAIAWGLTNGMVDDLDFYFEKIADEQYWNGEHWEKLEKIKERISVRDREDPEEFEILLTSRGPLINAVQQLWQGDSLAVSFRWTGFDDSDEFKAVSLLNHATTWSQFQEAVRHFKVPCQNFVYADTAGNIGYWAGGRVPIRRDGQGYLPYRGWEPNGDWTGDIPFEQMPHSFNPPQHYIATANNRMYMPGYPFYISNAWEPTSRIERITEMILSAESLDVEQIKRMQLDQVSAHARYTLPRLLQFLAKYRASGNELNEKENHAERLLQQWDGNEAAENVAAAIYNVWALEFLKAIIQDELGDDLFEAYCVWTTLPTRALEHFASHPESHWFDDHNTPETETAAEIAVLAFGRALATLEKRCGNLIGDWEWGKLHQLTLSHVVGERKPLDQVFNVGPVAMGGSQNSVSKAAYSLNRPFNVLVGPSLRMVVDLSNPMTGNVIIPGGQSGQPFSPHYKDQFQRWLEGRYRELPMAAEKIQTSCENILRLVPQLKN